MLKCNNCNFEINSSLVFAIKSNVCPACGENIYDNDIKESFASLYGEILEHKTPESIAIYLLTKYNLVEKNPKRIIDEVNEDVYDVKANDEPKKIKSKPISRSPDQPQEDGNVIGDADVIKNIRKQAGLKPKPITKADILSKVVDQIQSDDELLLDPDEGMISSTQSSFDTNLTLDNLFDTEPQYNDAAPVGGNKFDVLKSELKKMQQEDAKNQLMSGGSVGKIIRSG
jgi:hypothetical protein